MLARRQLCNLIAISPSLIRTMNTCPLPIPIPIQFPVSSPVIPQDRESLCWSVIEGLVDRGLYSSGQAVLQRIISKCCSVLRVEAALEFAMARGLRPDVGTYGVVIRRLVDLDETQFAERFYDEVVMRVCGGFHANVLNSMVICYCKLGKLGEAKRDFGRLVKLNCFPCRAACVVLIRELCAKGEVLDAYGCFLVCIRAHVVLGGPCFERLIYGLCDRGYLDEARDVFDEMLRTGECHPVVNLYKSLYYCACAKGRPVEAELLGWEMQSRGYFVDEKMFTSVIKGYCRGRRLKMAMRVFFRMRKMYSEPDNHVYNTLIDAFFKMGMKDEGLLLHKKMVEWGNSPDVVTYQILITECCREQRVDYARTHLNVMIDGGISPNVQCYTPIIDALIKNDRFLDAKQLLLKMLDHLVLPDHVLFFKLKKYSGGKELDLAEDFLGAIAVDGCVIESSSIASVSTMDLDQKVDYLVQHVTDSNPRMTPVAFGISISALCAGGRVSDALCYLGKMVSLGYQPLLSSWNSLIKCLLSLGHDPDTLLQQVRNNGLLPNLDTYQILIHGLCKRNDIASAIGYLDQMYEDGINPSASVYDPIINCLCRMKRIPDASYMIVRMLEDGINPDEVSYVTMISGFSKNGKAYEASKFFDKMVEQGIQPTERAYTALMYGLVKKNMIREKYLERMLEDGFVPNNVFFTSIISQFLRRGELRCSLRLLDLMDTNYIEGDRLMYIALMSGISRNISRRTPRNVLYMSNRSKRMRVLLFNVLECSVAQPSRKVFHNAAEDMRYLAKALMQEIIEKDYGPCIYLYNCIMYIFCRENRMRKAYEHLELMLERRIPPNHVTFTILINKHFRRGEVDHALCLFKKMGAYGCKPDRVMYNTLIRGLCRVDRFVDALSLVVTMQKQGLFPSKDCYQSLLYSAFENVQLHAARFCV